MNKDRLNPTQQTFNQIAGSWYNYRHRTIFPAELDRMASLWRKGKLLNVGCGHGADSLPFKDGFELHGIDFSRTMLELAQKYAAKFNFDISPVEADARCLPYRDGAFDCAIAVASYHHIETEEGRQQAFRELLRVLKPGGEAFITVWNRWQRRFWFKPKNVLVPWKTKEITLGRYYYLFTYREIKKALKMSGFTVLEILPESRYRFPVKWFSRNICVLVKKPAS